MIDLSGTKKAALLIMQLEDSVASKLLKPMHMDEITKISAAMSNLGIMPMEISHTVLKEAYDDLSKHEQHIIGNMDNTRDILKKILGDEEAENIINNIDTNIWNKLSTLEPEKLALYLRNENPQIISLVLQKLPDHLTSSILTNLPKELTIDVILCISHKHTVNPNVFDSLEHAINNDLNEIFATDNTEIIANIFDNFDRKSREQYMKALKNQDANLVKLVEQKMFNFDDISNIDTRGIQALFRNLDKDNLIIALKGADEDTQELFFQNMSERAANIMRDDMEDKGPLSMDQIEMAQQEVAREAKKLLNANEITLKNEV